MEMFGKQFRDEDEGANAVGFSRVVGDKKPTTPETVAKKEEPTDPRKPASLGGWSKYQ